MIGKASPPSGRASEYDHSRNQLADVIFGDLGERAVAVRRIAHAVDQHVARGLFSSFFRSSDDLGKRRESGDAVLSSSGKSIDRIIRILPVLFGCLCRQPRRLLCSRRAVASARIGDPRMSPLGFSVPHTCARFPLQCCSACTERTVGDCPEREESHVSRMPPIGVEVRSSIARAIRRILSHET